LIHNSQVLYVDSARVRRAARDCRFGHVLNRAVALRRGARGNWQPKSREDA